MQGIALSASHVQVSLAANDQQMACGGARHLAWASLAGAAACSCRAARRAVTAAKLLSPPAPALFNMSEGQLKSPFESEQEGGSLASGELLDSKAAEIADGSKLHTDGASEEEEDIPLLK